MQLLEVLLLQISEASPVKKGLNKFCTLFLDALDLKTQSLWKAVGWGTLPNPALLEILMPPLKGAMALVSTPSTN